MDDKTKSVEQLNVLNQEAISALKMNYPGAGIGPLVQARILELIERREVKRADQLPKEYEFLSAYIKS